MTISEDSKVPPAQATQRGEEVRKKAEELYELMGLDSYTRQSLVSLAYLGRENEEPRQVIVTDDNTRPESERD
jgi:hypothetical protein